ncbi:MAG: TolC family protein [Deltaproteobacteria bacterium]|nr:TolC family protein [Deltaproteobacteria bacterium]
MALEQGLRRAPSARVPRPPSAGPELPPGAPLAALVLAAVARDPVREAGVHRVRASLEEARAEASLPPPEVALEVWNLPLAQPYALGQADMYMVELRQRLTPSGMRDGLARASLEEARAVTSELAERELEVAERVTMAYSECFAAARHHALHEAHLTVLDAMREAVLARLSAGSGDLAQVARVEAERARVLRSLSRYHGDRVRASRALDALVQRPTGTDLGVCEAPSALTPREDPERLVTRALSLRGQVRAARGMERAALARAEASRAEARWPELMLGASYWQMPEQRPGVGLSIATSLPWLSPGGRARARAAEERALSARASAAEAERSVRAEVLEALSRMDTLGRELATLRAVTLPSLDRARDATAVAYIHQRAELLEWIDAARMRLDAEMDDADLVAELLRAGASLDRAVGAPVPRSPVTPEAP